ncbi:O-antigen ligase [Marinobacter daqiaonensis]|uniref:O-antigen ligase n=1 Tax=Marinobacter daqiaonensis TaxID=650891 RepID=A0A1I6HB77_9GAMM|nr:O-antigen ligase family protein [Marinobacter daqiaonensis]SFR51527.1 O-antigen ligase [Marinobacter daqiaonensis]
MESAPQFSKRIVTERLAFPIISVIFLSLLYALFVDFLPVISGAYADRRLMLCFLLLMSVIICLWCLVYDGLSGAHCLTLWPFAPLTLCLMFFAFQSSTTAFAAVEAIFYALFFVSFGLTGYCIRKAGLLNLTVEVLVFAIGVACFFYSAMTVTVYLFAVADDFSGLDQVIPWGFVNIRYWSHLATWFLPLLPLAALVIPFRTNRLWIPGMAVTAAIWWWIVFLSGSRGTMVGLATAVIIILLVFGRAFLPWFKTFFRYFVFGVATWLLLSVIIPSVVFGELQIRNLRTDSSGRMPLWQEAWTMSLQKFPFGMGPQSWLTHDILTDSYQGSKKVGHPHNMYLMWAAEYGWLTLVAMALPAIVGFRRLLAARTQVAQHSKPHLLCLIGISASVLAALIHAAVSAVFIAPASMLAGFLILSMFWALTSQYSLALPAISKGVGWVGRGVGVVLILIVAGGGGWWLMEVWRYHNAMIIDTAYYEEHIELGRVPRFWAHGNYPRHPSLMPPLNDSPD